jgi:hypothetical protein
MAMVVLAAILIATPVLAAGSSHPREAANPSPKKQPTIISMTGTIMTDDGVARTGTGQIYFAIQMTNKAFRQYRGETEWVKINGSTVCILWLKSQKSTRISCSELVAKSMNTGTMISINAKVDPKTKEFTARRVQLNQPRVP